jgi:hypothetical protein
MQILIFINKWNNGTTSTVDERDKIYDTKYGNSHRSPRNIISLHPHHKM